MKKTIFIDFDGTITQVDSCAAMVEAFARDGWQELNQLWEEKQISTEECANRTFQLFDTGPNELKGFLEKITIDDYFLDFLQLCRNKDYKVYILSDGYDFNIDIILQKYHIDIPYFSNHLFYEGGFRIHCPNINQACGNCGTCKTNLMLTLKEEDSQTIYIGDGYSDACAATKADLVFAKSTLYKLCQEKGLTAILYETFQDIISKMNLD